MRYPGLVLYFERRRFLRDFDQSVLFVGLKDTKLYKQQMQLDSLFSAQC